MSTEIMKECLKSAEKSLISDFKDGACVVNSKGKVITSSLVCNNWSDDCFANSSKEKIGETRNSPYMCHAVMNAIAKAIADFEADIKGGSIYCKYFPCNECAKLIIQTGIEQVFYSTDEYTDEEQFQRAKEMFEIVNNVKMEPKYKLLDPSANPDIPSGSTNKKRKINK